ncbi:unnamed protein product [Aphanomyces euteiches]
MVTSGVPMSDPEVISVDESEEDECLDMSNPMAHVKSQSNQSKPDQGQVKAKNQPRRESVTSTSSEESEVDEQLVPTPIVGKTVDLATESDEDEAFESKQTSNEDDRGSINLGKAVTQPEKSAPDNASKPKVTLSKWASRFLTPRAKPLVLEEPELEPLRDYILDDFGTRFRGNAGEEPQVDDDNEDSDNDDNSKLTVVGAPIVAKAEPKNDKPEKSKSDNPKVRKESRYFRKDLSTKCFNCGEIGHMSNACVNTTVMRPCFINVQMDGMTLTSVRLAVGQIMRAGDVPCEITTTRTFDAWFALKLDICRAYLIRGQRTGEYIAQSVVVHIHTT